MSFAIFQGKSERTRDSHSFRLLEDIAREMGNDMVFPVCFDVAMEARRVFNDPDQSVQQVYSIIRADPLICSKLLRLANSVIHNPGGSEIRDVKTAIFRLGMNTVRTTVLGVAMKQLMQAKGMSEFDAMMKRLWNHSISTASACYVLAYHLSLMINPDEAMLAGLVHDLGAFFLLYRASRYDELRAAPETVEQIVVDWHESIGDTLLETLGLPKEIIEAVRNHEDPRSVPPLPVTLNDLVHVGNVLMGGVDEWLHQEMETAEARRQALDGGYRQLLPEIERHAEHVRAAFA